MTQDAETAYRFLTEKPAQYGQMLGYPDLRDDLHGQWIREMVLGHEDMTLQAHRGSYKTTCACIGLSINILLRGDMNSIFLRKTDTDIQEVINNVIAMSAMMKQFDRLPRFARNGVKLFILCILFIVLPIFYTLSAHLILYMPLA